ncbi:hypothetical protein [Myxosarcina sp. GI1]|uniref:hypothetical protein n=1 Tax=Myxosarcina sp. GI1 TaxID=1541065 RepID=UPI00055CFD90|nr:hypothetical protein [Myxosarcina sp. GI1]
MINIIGFAAKILTNIRHSLFVPKNELQVEQKCDRYGHLFWQVYDPITRKSHTFGSDGDVRIWIEKRMRGL